MLDVERRPLCGCADATGRAATMVDDDLGAPSTDDLRLAGDPTSTRRQPDVDLTSRRQVRQKLANARRSHAERSMVAHVKDPTRPAYTARELEHGMGWTIEAMLSSFDDFMLGKCTGGCGRFAIDLALSEVSIDVIDRDLPPVWGVNTQFMCVKDNSKKNKKTHAQRIAEAMAELRRPMPGPPPIMWRADNPTSTRRRVDVAHVRAGDAPDGLVWASDDNERCPSMKRKPRAPRAGVKPRMDTWQCGLVVGHSGLCHAPPRFRQSPWWNDNATPPLFDLDEGTP
jgi:hypothetical protein